MSAKYYNLSLGEPKAPISNSLKNSLIDGINAEMIGYTAPIGDRSARKASAKILGTSISKTFMSCGCSGGLVVSLNVLCKQNDNVLIFGPYYPQFLNWVKQVGAIPIICNLTRTFRLPFVEIDKICKKTKINCLILNSPHNPTGRVFREKELEKLSELLDHETIVISEESYSHITFEHNAPNIFDFFPKAIKVFSFSKAYGIVGLRLGAVALGPDYSAKETSVFRKHFSSLQLRMGFVNPCTLAQYAIANTKEGFVDVDFYKQNRDYLAQELDKIGFSYIRPEGAFYFFLYLKNADQVIKNLYQKKIIISSGEKYGWPNWVRISFSIENEDFKKIVSILIAILKKVE